MAEEKRLMKGNEAIAEAAIRAGCTAYFGYPITPQNELTAYMAKHMLDHKRTFIQAESEVSAINMVYGAAATGARSMTSSSSPGVSLKQEGISYACGADVPCVVVNVARSGPGLGGISPSQGDYFQSTRGGGHGDYYHLVLAPKSVQEAADLTFEAFDLADEWRMPAMILADGLIGQMMEGVSFPPMRDLKTLPKKAWAAGRQQETHRPNNHITSLNLMPAELEQQNLARFKRYDVMKAKLQRSEEVNTDQAELILVAYGTSARIALGALQMAKAEGLEVGLFRPITLWPFPEQKLSELAAKGKRFLVVEMSMGQMIEDVRLVVNGRCEVKFYGRCGGMIPTEEEVLAEIKRLLGK
ncbi:MAG: 3-methyl-2-oxobutanoate dehydrogenase subunit VorB [Spirochaetes bacterium GWD1_61_31]|nr:MAG: 3-methyl-2-oxobutanoate dehydrogenase subunit VorB [Spirochaetes bacterium GWB1_60_80]OHD29308.1 MAG: 3-methyl-2-oxobutanoate dehydrogenase subunit VorB [Spirochaetes bacterium GWC1_61_12]OHD35816.1 MAG: 3-methyl-2-oxobutanoate dehydrogenase subunit VorB [Spirochaetes bacterium GWD1_61_31]OHD46757.1 MAG: 3-methyl-2-oxobutanoate dehydrogenase subunit VorB [Spirochaetes bacterium GWE1_60_18]OHD61209.1 MAG: 3-methyl-2-oxobutanoate dehydrogenase subunit VorB [Spirochaetes bacterium GWF1_60_